MGDTWQLFDWTGVNPSGAFASIVKDLPAGYAWNTSALYTLGDVTLRRSRAFDPGANCRRWYRSDRLRIVATLEVIARLLQWFTRKNRYIPVDRKGMKMSRLKLLLFVLLLSSAARNAWVRLCTP